MTDPSLARAAALFCAATAFGAAVSVAQGRRGEPLGLQVPGSVPGHLAAGWGAALSAPWPMPALSLVAARSDPRASWPGWACLGVGTGVICGTLIEPATWGRRGARGPLMGAAVAANVLSGALLVRAGWSRLRSASDPARST